MTLSRVAREMLIFAALTGLFYGSYTGFALWRVDAYYRALSSEARHNLKVIRSSELAYFAEWDTYVSCEPTPREVRDWRRLEWPRPRRGPEIPEFVVSAGGRVMEKPQQVRRPEPPGGFSNLGFAPESAWTRYQYAVAVAADGRSFRATATGDLDLDGRMSVFSVTDATKEITHEGDRW